MIFSLPVQKMLEELLPDIGISIAIGISKF